MSYEAIIAIVTLVVLFVFGILMLWLATKMLEAMNYSMITDRAKLNLFEDLFERLFDGEETNQDVCEDDEDQEV